MLPRRRSRDRTVGVAATIRVSTRCKLPTRSAADGHWIVVIFASTVAGTSDASRTASAAQSVNRDQRESFALWPIDTSTLSATSRALVFEAQLSPRDGATSMNSAEVLLVGLVAYDADRGRSATTGPTLDAEQRSRTELA